MRSNLPWFSKNAIAMSAVALSVGALAACTSSSSSSTSTSTSTSPSASSSGSASPATTSAPITIGASLSLHGDFSADGTAFQAGYKLWAADVNAHGGLLGRQVKLTILDDNSSPNQVVTNYQTLINTDHVDLTFGPFSSLLTGPASAVAARSGYAFVEGAGGAPTVFNTPSNLAAHNVFDVSLPIADELMPFVNYVASLPASQRPKTAAYPMADDPFATPPVQAAQAKLEALGVKTVYSKIFPEEVADYTAPGGPGGAEGPGRGGPRLHRRPHRPGVHEGVRAAALHAEAVHRRGRPGPGRRVHLRGGRRQRRRHDGAQRLVPRLQEPGQPGDGVGVHQAVRRGRLRRQRRRGRGLFGRPGHGSGRHRRPAAWTTRRSSRTCTAATR